jgi:hypothetical protein
MNLKKFTNLAEITGIIAILVSLIAIYIQQRADRDLARAELQHEAFDVTNSLYEYLTRDAETFEAIRAGFQDYEGATPIEQVRFGYLMHRGINVAERVVFLRNDNLIDEQIYRSSLGIPLMYLKTPGGRQYWQQVRLAYTEDVHNAIDEGLEERTDVPIVWELYPFFAPEPAAPIANTDAQTEDSPQ